MMNLAVAKYEKIPHAVMKVREPVYQYLTQEAARTKRTAQGEMELWAEMFQMVLEEFKNDDPDQVREEIKRLRKGKPEKT
jgi:hypothetical protein